MSNEDMMLALAASFSFNISLNPNLSFLSLFNKWVNLPTCKENQLPGLDHASPHMLHPNHDHPHTYHFNLHLLLKQCCHPFNWTDPCFWREVWVSMMRHEVNMEEDELRRMSRMCWGVPNWISSICSSTELILLLLVQLTATDMIVNTVATGHVVVPCKGMQGH